MYVTEDKIMCGLRGGSGAQLYPQSGYVHPTEKVCNYQYTHPSTKQCNYSYTHPTSKQCTWNPDLSSYATKSELSSVSSPWKLLQSFSSNGTLHTSNTEYALFLFCSNFTGENDGGHVSIRGTESGAIGKDIYDNIGYGTFSVFISRTYIDNSGCGYYGISLSTMNDYGKFVEIESMKSSPNDQDLELTISGSSGFSGRLYGIA